MNEQTDAILPTPASLNLPTGDPCAHEVRVLHESCSLLIAHKPAGLPLSGSKPRTLTSILQSLVNPQTTLHPLLSPPRPVSGPVIFSASATASQPAAVFTLHAIVIGPPTGTLSDATLLHSCPIPSPAGNLLLLELSSTLPGTGLRKRLREVGAPVLGDVVLSGLPARGLYLAISRVEFPSMDLVVHCPLPPKFGALVAREGRLEHRRQLRETREARTWVDETCGEKKTRFLDWYFVTENALTPRKSSECIARTAAELLQSAFRRRLKVAEQGEVGTVRLLDLGTGCGNLLIGSLLLADIDAEGVGVELSEPAVLVARRNVRELDVAHLVKVFRGDFARLEHVSKVYPDGFDVIVSNPPYLTRKEVELEQGGLAGEPDMALIAQGEYGMGAYHDIAAGLGKCKGLVKKNGYLVLEVGGTKSHAKIRDIFEKVAGLHFTELRMDERGFKRCLIMQRRAS